MALFQTSVLNKYLSEQDNQLVTNQYSIFKEYFLNTTIQQNIIASKEEEFQEGFLRELFVKVLGYTINPEPNFNLITELKNEKDSKKADGAIKDGDKVLAVIELKSTKTTDFNKIEIQAFNYKNNQANCKYVITSNFQKIRFYIDNAIEFLEWDLFKLDIENFKLLFLCLHKDSIFKNIPATIKTESITVEDNVTKKLYKEYSQFRKSLFNNIVELNPTIDKLLVFKKTQKLLDRFLFLFFAEDRMLVPPNSVRIILEQWNNLKDMDAYQPLYNRFKLYFGYLNAGHKGKLHDIFAYNGGLFAPDEILDTIKMDDSILYNAAISLSNYDYNSEVDVNILGHIFEHSLTEIEELEKEITNTDIVENKTTKRKKDGVFYTPKYITKYIVENTVGTLCKNKKEELKLQEEDYHKLTKKAKKQLFETLLQYKEWLLHITIIDPACGSGAFLNQALEFLIAEHKWISELEANITNSSIVFDIETTVLENNIFGVDINEESVEIAKLSLWLRTARKGRKLNSLNNNIKCGNSLIDDVSVAGDKAFNWQEQFSQIFDKGGFDVVIGNPPYVLCQQSNTPENILESYKKYKVASYKIDLFHLFYEKGINILKEKGYLSFITPNTFLTNKYIQKLRNFILTETHIIELVNYNEIVFVDAGVDVATLVLKKIQTLNTEISIVNSSENVIYKSNTCSQIDWNSNPEQIFNIKSNTGNYFENCKNLGEIGNTYFGIQAFDRKSSISVSKINNNYIEIIDGADIFNYQYSTANKYFNFIESNIKSGGDWNIYLKERIVIRQIGKTPIVGICSSTILTSNTIYNFYTTDSEYNLRYILCILNSSLIKYYWMLNYNDNKDLFPKIKGYQLKQLPIRIATNELQQPFIEKAEIILSKNKELQQANSQFQKLLSSKFETLTINTKLEKWHTLSFADFCKELTKQKIKLSLSQQSEWLTFFEQEKQKALAIKNEIDKTDAEIDKMVYALYGLTEEEIKIVEKG